MPLLPTDIITVYSGGGTNANPSLSLGGNPSSQQINMATNNLFDDISEFEAASGFTDYRCFYVFNDNETDALYNCTIFIDSQTAGGAEIAMGILFQPDIQQILISGTPTSGNFLITYTGNEGPQTVTVNWNPNLITWAANIETALNSIPEIYATRITASSNNGQTAFVIAFDGAGANKYQDILSIANNLIGSPTPTVTVSKFQNGSPINSIAQSFTSSLSQPSGVIFSAPTSNSPIVIGNLLGGSSFPVWIQRSVAAGSATTVANNFIVKVQGQIAS